MINRKLAFLVAVLILFPLAAEEQKGVERFALYVGSNNGGSGRELLRYAGTDAMYISKAMSEIGGIPSSNSIILVDPLKEDINGALDAISLKIAKAAFTAKRTEFVFYYSGHSDENALLLGSDKYDYSGLKAAVSDVPSDVHIVMLDSCFSGNFIRAKGGSRQKSFLQDDSSIVQGHAYLSSSSESESSQESDALQGSYFTHALVTGLRGAADSSGDNKVSLNELYYYAHNDTLARTEKSAIGPQHPSYNITLVGSGDLILSDITDADSVMYLPAESEGRFFIRNPAGILVSEVTKVSGSKLALALEAGTYNVTMINGNTVSQTSVTIEAGKEYSIRPDSFFQVPRTTGRARGGSTESSFLATDDDIDESLATQPVLPQFGPNSGWHPFVFSIGPGMAFPSPKPEYVNFSLGLFSAVDTNIMGLQIAGFSVKTTGSLNGLQAAGFMAFSDGFVSGFQAAGFLGVVRSDFYGMQSAGFYNRVSGNLTGIQSAGILGIVNNGMLGAQVNGFLSILNGEKSGRGVQASGFLNIASCNLTGLQVAGFMNISTSDFYGLQATGLVNIANKVHGAQIGIFNIANENTGVAIGLFNFIRNGVMSPAIFYDSNGVIYAQYQGGTKHFFTTYLMSVDNDSALLGFGVGTQFTLNSFMSLDFEVLSKQVVAFDIDEVIESADDDDGPRGIKWLNETVPEARVTLNFRIAKRFAIGVMGAVDVHVDGYNDESFETKYFSDMEWTLSDRCSLHPSASLVIKM